MSDENSACLVSIKHNTLSDGDVKVCLTYGTYVVSGSGLGPSVFPRSRKHVIDDFVHEVVEVAKAL